MKLLRELKRKKKIKNRVNNWAAKIINQIDQFTVLYTNTRHDDIDDEYCAIKMLTYTLTLKQ
jgi:hypothetical protein